MLSSQQRLAIRIARRRLPIRQHVFYYQNQQGGPLSTLSSSRLFHSSSSSSSSRRDGEAKSTMQLQGLPLIIPPSSTSWNGRSSNYNASILARSYPMGCFGGSNRLWFSTAAKDDNDDNDDRHKHDKPSYRERAAHYRERASHYSDQAKDGAKTFGGMMKKYGPVFIGTYLSVYVATLGGLYVGVESGVLDPVTLLGYITGNHQEARSSAEVVAELLEHYTLTQGFAEMVRAQPGTANFAVAWISTKFTEPVRFGVTVAVVPRVARYFGVVPAVEQDETADADGDADKAAATGEADEAATKESDKSTKTEDTPEEKKA